MPPPEKPGDILGSYELVEPIGEGSMGRVYLGRHTRLGRLAAIKVLKHEHARDRDLVQRFFDEARAVNHINHEHIVEVFDFVVDAEQDRVYCVMERLVGRTLTEAIAQGALPLTEILKLAAEVCEALTAAHAVGVVHRDLKPDNIFLAKRGSRDDFVKVLDFGVAKLNRQIKGDATTSTASGAMVGTPAYMPPEQVVGLDVDARADLYALGAVLYQLLSGRLPFVDDKVGRLSLAIIKTPAPPLPAKTPRGEEIPPELSRLVMQCLAKEPDARPSSAKEVGAFLSALARGGQAPMPSSVRPPRRSRSGPIAGAIAALLVAIGLVAALTRSEQPRPAPVAAPADSTPTTAVVTIATTPPGATVTLADGSSAPGTTPLRVTVPRGETPLMIAIALAGYTPVTREVRPVSDLVLDVTLTPVPPPTLAVTPASPGPPKRAAPKTKKKIGYEDTLDPFAN